MPKSIPKASEEFNLPRLIAWSFTVSVWALIAAIFMEIQWYLSYWSEPLNSGRDEYLEGVAITAVMSWPVALVGLGLAIFGNKFDLTSAQRSLIVGLSTLWLVLTLAVDFV